MQMKVKDLLNYQDEIYMIISIVEYNNNEYLFANKLDDNENSTDNYTIFSNINGLFSIVTDQNIIKQLLPLFQNKIKDTVKKYL